MSQKPSADREELAISHARRYRGRCLPFVVCVRGLPCLQRQRRQHIL
jgi:hypothetical protein